jgi:uncharacterized membrane protein YagU involved in acid resistance
MNVQDVLLWGFVASLVVTAVMSAGYGLRLSRISLPLLLGTMFTANRDRAGIVGFLAHLLLGWLLAAIYALAFESWERATWWLGAIIGMVHALVVLVAVMPILPNVHPRMASERRGPEPTRQLEPPGFLALHYGRRTPLITFVAHILYGAVIGANYHLVA